ncbi:MAG: type II toxin-antitoxin system RelE/ParE family toxin [Dehalococcoidia bacterium]
MVAELLEQLGMIGQQVDDQVAPAAAGRCRSRQHARFRSDNTCVIVMGMDVVLLAEANRELKALPNAERAAMINVLEKLAVLGQLLAVPHISQVKRSSLRELRPRAGRSPSRAFYRRIGIEMVVDAIGPEAKQDRQGFNRSVQAAEARLSHYEAERRQ